MFPWWLDLTISSCLASLFPPRYEEGRSILEGCAAPALRKDLGSHSKSSQRLLCGLVGQALPQEESALQTNGVGLGDGQGDGGCSALQRLPAEMVRLSRPGLARCHRLCHVWSLMSLMSLALAQVPASCPPSILRPTVCFVSDLPWFTGWISVESLSPNRAGHAEDVLLKSGEKFAAIIFRTLRPIPKNWQAWKLGGHAVNVEDCCLSCLWLCTQKISKDMVVHNQNFVQFRSLAQMLAVGYDVQQRWEVDGWVLPRAWAHTRGCWNEKVSCALDGKGWMRNFVMFCYVLFKHVETEDAEFL